MKIGDLARETGVSPRLLRYYEEQGLITAQRAASGHRRYTQDTVEAVARIRMLLGAGLPTSVIAGLMDCFTGGTELEACAEQHLRAHLDGIESRIAQLQETRSALTALIGTTAAPAPRQLAAA
ncbi:MerR family transcriptional regulator [Yinghuangia soli]|uniref:MerR family transcriptional regulator n=1 Tax=Yinghuangia soli TaxID=2908204 RepID=A0AA41TXF0_9ACTN|nr:MerR family transcriptional regulator [Yinghuangia soli]MCF2526768.1 MerR family transcriptional regulator [Yinghuangia soli]